MGFLSAAVSYSMRASFAVAITEIAKPINKPNEFNRSMICGNEHYSEISPSSKAHTVGRLQILIFTLNFEAINS